MVNVKWCNYVRGCVLSTLTYVFAIEIDWSTQIDWHCNMSNDPCFGFFKDFTSPGNRALLFIDIVTAVFTNTAKSMLQVINIVLSMWLNHVSIWAFYMGV